MTNISNLDWLPVYLDGDDLVSPLVHATWFGGDSDPEDNGQTASGVPTRGNPALLGCALPLAGYGLRSLRGTPLPMMAFGLHHDGTPNPEGAWIEFTSGSLTLLLPCIDLGPALRTRHGVDLTVAAFKRFTGGGLHAGVISGSLRLKRGALHLPAAILPSADLPSALAQSSPTGGAL